MFSTQKTISPFLNIFDIISLFSAELEKSKILRTLEKIVCFLKIVEGNIWVILTHYHTMPHFDALKTYIAVENIVRKGEIACNPMWHSFSF